MNNGGGPTLRRSANIEFALTAPRPRLRGLLHLVAALLSPPVGVLWILSGDGIRERWALGAFMVGIVAMFGASALFHARRWSPRVFEVLFRLDHTGIYLAIGGTGVAVALLGLQGWPTRVMLGVVVLGVALGIAVEWLPFAPPRGFSNTVYLTLGWVPVILLPWLWSTSGPVAVGLLLLGGVIYTSGAVMVALKRPDPWPAWFGYHELWHLFVLLAVLCHALMLERMTA